MKRMKRRSNVTRAMACAVAIAMLLLTWSWQPQNVSASTNVYYVAMDGDDDTGDGSLLHPWRTIQKAAGVMGPGDTCYIRQGVYRETVVPANSGTEGAPITFRSYPSETATISGADPVTGWSADTATLGRLIRANMPWTLAAGNQIFVNGVPADEARWPNQTGTLLEPTLAVADAGTNTTITMAGIPADIDWVGATIWFAGGAAWAGQDSTVTGFDPVARKVTFTQVKSSNTNYDARAGNAFYLFGVKGALDQANEWWYDTAAQQLYVQPPAGYDASNVTVEAKRRLYGLDLSGRSHIRLEGLRLLATSLKTDDSTHHIVIDKLKAEYVAHSSRNKTASGEGRPTEENNGITLRGAYNEVTNSEIAYSSGSLLRLLGKGHKVVNSYIHDGDYAGTWDGLLLVQGENHYVGYNTLTRSGRDVLKPKPTGEGRNIIEHNDLSYGGLVTNDTGLIYTAGNDARQTEIRYNTLHDMYTHLGMGIYTDNQSSHFVIHHNVIWNVPNSDPIRLNSPSNYNHVYNNTAGTNTKGMATWAIVFKGDMYGDRIYNNILTGGGLEFGDSAGYAAGSNIVSGLDPEFVDAAGYDFRLKSTSPGIDAGKTIPNITDGYTGLAPDIGAYEYGQPRFKTGHDFANPPSSASPVAMVSPYVNKVTNGGFEDASLPPWTVVKGAAEPVYSTGAAWSSQTAIARTQSGGVRLKGPSSEIEQSVTGLQPNTRYTLSLWAKTSSPASTAAFGVRGHGGGAVTGEVYSTDWTHRTFDFTTGPAATSASVYLGMETQGGSGGTLAELDTQTASAAGIWLNYDATSFIQTEAAGDGIASINLKGASSRTTFALKRTGTKQPVLSVMTADSPVPLQLLASNTAGVRLRTGTTSADENYGNPTSFNAANWNSGYQEEIYLQFPLSALAGKQIVSATLQLYANGIAAEGAKSTAYGLSADNWQESTLTWNTKPQAELQSVYYDDIGVILPLDDATAADALRSLVIDARRVYNAAAAGGEYDPGVIADFLQAIEAAETVLGDAGATPAQIAAAAAALQGKEEALSARERLLAVIAKARTADAYVVEGVLPGQYEAGAKTALRQALANAEAAFADTALSAAAILTEQNALTGALALLEERVIATDLPLLPKTDISPMLASPASWSDSYTASSGWNVFSKDVTKYTAAQFGSTLLAWNMKYVFLNSGSEYPGMVIRSQTPNKPLNQDTTYFVAFKPDIWELQKWVGGKQKMYLTFPNTQFTGAESRIYFGAINVEGGVRVLVYVDGVKAIDVIDRDNPITQDGYFGFTSAGQSGDISVRAGQPQPETLLVGTTRAIAGEEASLRLRLYGPASSGVSPSVYGSVYGVTASLRFDPALVEITGATSLVTGANVSVAVYGNTADVALAAGSGAVVPANGDVIEIKWKGKAPSSSTTITPYNVAIVGSGGSPVTAIPFARRLEIGSPPSR